MSLIQALLNRRTVHNYKPEPVDQELIRQALVASLHVPNHKHTKPIRYRRVGKETRAKLASIALELKQAKQSGVELTPVISEAIRSQYLYPDTLIVVSQIAATSDLQRKEDFATLACALHNISLVLWPHGVGTKWSSGEITRSSKTYELLRVDPAKETIEAFFWIGIPSQIPGPQPKASLNDILIEIE